MAHIEYIQLAKEISGMAIDTHLQFKDMAWEDGVILQRLIAGIKIGHSEEHGNHFMIYVLQDV